MKFAQAVRAERAELGAIRRDRAGENPIEPRGLGQGAVPREHSFGNVRAIRGVLRNGPSRGQKVVPSHLPFGFIAFGPNTWFCQTPILTDGLVRDLSDTRD